MSVMKIAEFVLNIYCIAALSLALLLASVVVIPLWIIATAANTLHSLVASRGQNGSFAGIWRIWTADDGRGKASVESAKKGLGVAKGGAVRIGGIAPLIGIAEGIETALAARQLIYEECGQLIPVWAALSAVGLRNIELPSQVHAVKIFTDNDPIKFRHGLTIRTLAWPPRRRCKSGF